MKFKSILKILVGISSIVILSACNATNQLEDNNLVNDMNNNTSLQINNDSALVDSTEKDQSQNKLVLEINSEKIKEEESLDKIDEQTDAVREVEEQKEVEHKITATKGTYYVSNHSLNVRAGIGTSYDILGTINLNTEVTVTGKADNGWYEINYKDKTGYVSGNYLSAEKQVVKEPPTKTEVSQNKTPAKKETKAKEPERKEAPKAESNKNVIEKMNSLGNSEQVILVTTKGYNTSTGRVRTFEKQSDGKWKQIIDDKAHIGKNGFADNKKEGDGKSPTGKYTIGTAFGYKGNPGTKIGFKHTTEDDVWVDDSKSKYYNTWQSNSLKDKDWNSAESMMHRLYGYGFVINYNTAQTPDKGSAIFMHTGDSYTLGCVATNQTSLTSIMTWIDPAKNPVIIQIPEENLESY